ncbi:uncharacterized protein LOC111621165 isoform X1 [Centruroides sculpturatus]|uniref:uncharacterized protein LOC111621165 isoform X1 n=1 Tax=Centruroides sculpturatus TaxID=218467 RepID=UPI000C6CBF91|nr:uncharacterized protein LOC111621165 isoform X1 [Centruroides sculpturatus]
MQWRKRRKLIYVIGSGRHSLLMKSFRLHYPDNVLPTGREDGSCHPLEESSKEISDIKTVLNTSENKEAFSDIPIDGERVADNRIITGCYVNGLWMPVDFDTAATFYPIYAPPTVTPLWSNDMSFSHSNFNASRQPENFPRKNYTSSPYWANSYLQCPRDVSDDLTFVPYLYPGYTFGPSVYSAPIAEFPLQDIRRKKRNKRKPIVHELRQIKPGVDAISTPSCDVIRYANSNNKKYSESVMDTDRNENSDQISIDPSVSSGKVDDKSTNEEHIADALDGNNPTSIIPNIATLESEVNSENNADSAHKMDGVKTVSRFKVYPCSEDTLKVKDVEEKTEVSASPQTSTYYNYSENLLRETELELNKLNKKAFQANQAIYQLAYDESVTDEDSRPESRADDIDTSATCTKDELPEDLRDPPGSRMEIQVHEMDTASEAGSEDVEILGHRYETSASPDKHVYVNKLSLAAELLRTKESLPYDNEFKRVVDDDTPTIQLKEKSDICRADSGVQSEESGDEVIEEIKNPIIQREEMWSTYQGRHYRRQVPNQVPYFSTIQRNGPFSPCLCCVVM